jgi:hypothetical protein
MLRSRTLAGLPRVYGDEGAAQEPFELPPARPTGKGRTTAGSITSGAAPTRADDLVFAWAVLRFWRGAAPSRESARSIGRIWSPPGRAAPARPSILSPKGSPPLSRGTVGARRGLRRASADRVPITLAGEARPSSLLRCHVCGRPANSGILAPIFLVDGASKPKVEDRDAPLRARRGWEDLRSGVQLARSVDRAYFTRHEPGKCGTQRARVAAPSATLVPSTRWNYSLSSERPLPPVARRADRPHDPPAWSRTRGTPRHPGHAEEPPLAVEQLITGERGSDWTGS